jgi:hypothetical protein
MRMRITPVLLSACCLLGPGCSFVRCIKLNLLEEPKLATDEKVILNRHERLAREAWDAMVAQYGCQFSDDYRRGFIDGFVDYLTYGGTSAEGEGEVPIVPAVPPPYYRHYKAMSPEGLKASEDWFAGFRHGSSTALASGLRHLVVVPVFDKPNPSLEDAPGRYQSLPGRAPSNTETQPQAAPPPPPEGEPLPQPRTVPPAGGEQKPVGPEQKPPAGPAVPPTGPTVPPAGPLTPPTGPTTPPSGPATPTTPPAPPPAAPATAPSPPPPAAQATGPNQPPPPPAGPMTPAPLPGGASTPPM